MDPSKLDDGYDLAASQRFSMKTGGLLAAGTANSLKTLPIEQASTHLQQLDAADGTNNTLIGFNVGVDCTNAARVCHQRL